MESNKVFFSWLTWCRKVSPGGFLRGSGGWAGFQLELLMVWVPPNVTGKVFGVLGRIPKVWVLSIFGS